MNHTSIYREEILSIEREHVTSVSIVFVISKSVGNSKQGNNSADSPPLPPLLPMPNVVIRYPSIQVYRYPGGNVSKHPTSLPHIGAKHPAGSQRIYGEKRVPTDLRRKKNEKSP